MSAMREQADVLVVGAGLAGMSAAVALSGAGARTLVLERKPFVGGRAYSYAHPALGEVIDSQHVLLGCCTNLVDLCRASGADKHIRWYDAIPFLEPGASENAGARSSVLRAGMGPAASLGFLRAPMLSLRDKAGIARGLMEFVRGYPAQDDEAFSDWLKRTKQTERAVRHFWEPVVVATLNDSLDRCSTRYAGEVFYEGFLKSAAGGRMGVPTLPLSEFYAPVAELAERQGAEVRLRASVDAIRREGGLWFARLNDGTEVGAEKLVLALPFEQTRRLMETLPGCDAVRMELLPKLARFQHAPITTIHLWFDRAVTEIDQCALLDTRIQWMFNKTRIRRDEPGWGEMRGQYLELVISASFAELEQTREEILRSAVDELARFFPAVREARVVKSGVLKEARATFSVLPGMDVLRPAAAAGDGLFLAGDWTATGWPSTMEGAVRSGRLAAEAVTGKRALVEALPATSWMRWLGASCL